MDGSRKPAIQRVRAPLDPEQEERILAFSAAGLTVREIAEQKGVHVSRTTIGRFLKECRRERAATTKSVVHECIAATLPSDIERLDAISRDLEFMRRDSVDTREILQIVDRQLKTIALKLKHSGAQEDDSAQRLIELLSGE